MRTVRLSLRRKFHRLKVVVAVGGLVLCVAVISPAHGSGGITIPSQFFGQHLDVSTVQGKQYAPDWNVTAQRLWGASGATWCEIEGSRGTYNFSSLNTWLDKAAASGADTVYTFGLTPGWAAGSTGGCTTSTIEATPPTNSQDLVDFAAALVNDAVSRGTPIKYYELWNEADTANYWSGTAQQLASDTALVAAKIRALDASAKILSPSVVSLPSQTFLGAYLSALSTSQTALDAVAIHVYTSGKWPETYLGTSGGTSDIIGQVEATMTQAGYGAVPLWSTEGGWGKNNQNQTLPTDQRAFVARYDLALASRGLARAYWYAYASPMWGTLWSPPGPLGSLTPAGVATKTLVGWLGGATLAQPCSVVSGIWTCDLTEANGTIGRIVWVESGTSPGYSTGQFTTERTLDGAAPTHPGNTITVGTEPVLLEQ